MRILLIEDDEKISSQIIKGMTKVGFETDHAETGPGGLEKALKHSYAAAIVDVMLPRKNGLWVISELRRREINLPVIILSARCTTQDRIKGFQSGGDDYLHKPFSLTELVVRIQALIRRSNSSASPGTISAGDLSINLLHRTTFRGSRQIDLQPREFRLLEYLMRHQGQVVTREMLIRNVWGYNFDPYTNVVPARICRLREKIDNGFTTRLIHTVRGIGYVLKATD